MTKPPAAKKMPRQSKHHGHTRTDDYAWLRERDNPVVAAHLEAENIYTEVATAHLKDLRETLFQEMVARLDEEAVSAPIRHGDYQYYAQHLKGQQYPLYWRKHIGSGEEEIIIDFNEEAAGSDYLRLGVYKLSPDGRYLAYSINTDGSEAYVIHIKDLSTGELLPERIPGSYYSLAWAADGRHFFYTVINEANRPYKLYGHRLGTASDEDPERFHERDEKFNLSLKKTKDSRYLVLSSASLETSEAYLLASDDPEGAFGLVQARAQGVRYSVEHRDGTLYLLTNLDAPNFRLVTAPAAEPSKENWRDFVSHREHIKLEGFDLFADHLALYFREDGLKRLSVTHLSTGSSHRVSFPEEVYSFSPGIPVQAPAHFAQEGNPDFNASTLRLTYTSLVTPETVYDYDMSSRERKVVKATKVFGYEPEAFVTERLFARAEDGTEIPLSLVYKRNLKRDGSNPCLLYGYGSYGAVIEPSFLAHRVSLLERGFVFVVAHVRGGGELGRAWYEMGKLLNKKTTFTDFIACAKALIDEGYTSPDTLAVTGRSAGGLLMGAVVNLAPDLAKAVVAGVPFVDVMNTMLDASLPLTVAEYEEWGDPNDQRYYDYMRSYSPYDNVEAKAYPHMLVTAGLNDKRVSYWEPAKWVAKLRELKTDDNQLLLKTNMGAGHSGASGRYDYLREVAFEYALIIDTLRA